MRTIGATLLGWIFLFGSCNEQGNSEMDHEEHAFTNNLINETSPYLLQHAHNPVDWYAWGDEALQAAKDQDKLILVSIGYSACHWCHVMERETFEDTTIARVMNENFICIKVDREERPDVDQVYMNAVQLMRQRGGWPLNCFTLPDGRPIYGGTYFQPEQWSSILEDLSYSYQNDRQRLVDYADNLTKGVQQSEMVVKSTVNEPFNNSTLQDMVAEWSKNFDMKEGGPNRAPKFPLPNNYQYLLRYAHLNNETQLAEHVHFTLKRMAYGGIYDQVGGGFARYSTDVFWKVPHFEKMLYDNAQLVSLYSEAFQSKKDKIYEDVVEQTLEFISRELTAENGAFYSALDADSEGEEGKFYVWKKDELDSLLGINMKVAKEYYNVNGKGLWEHGNYILLRDKDDKDVAKKLDMPVEKMLAKVGSIRATLLEARSGRVRPGLDDKSLTSWNAMMANAYANAYSVFGKQNYLDAAEKNIAFILTDQRREDGGLNHSYKAGRSTINGYLEDYSYTVEALLTLYECTFNEEHLNHALELAEYAITHFYDENSGMFWFTSDLDPPLIARKMEVTDNVIPASNSSMAKGLFRLGHLLDRQDLLDISEQQLKNMTDQMVTYGSSYSNWGMLMLDQVNPFYEVAITGNGALEFNKQFGQHYIPNKMLLGAKNNSELPLLEGKFFDGASTIFVCVNKSCQLPVESVDEALKQIE